MDNKDRLSPKAYEVIDGLEYPPFVGPEENIAEFTAKAIIIGALIGAVFGAANAYLGLKVGLTVSASIPAAVMAVAIFKIMGRGTILETNMVQTIGSAGESLAAGVIFTVPAFFLWGLSPAKSELVLISILGGMLGVLFMIPLRRFLIVREHGKLPYPEGTACAEVLVAGQGEAGKAKVLFAGMGIGGLYQFLMSKETFGFWTKEPEAHVPGYPGAIVAGEITPELLGVGYIIGPRIAAIMLAGGLLGWFVLIPLFTMFGQHVSSPIFPETTVALKDMGPWQIWSKYVRYIGAGGVAFAGIFALIKSIPVILESFSAGLKGMGAGGKSTVRTQNDLPMRFILFGSLGLACAIAVYLGSTVFDSMFLTAAVSAVLIVLFSFFFVTVSSRIVGLLGSSSNPVSGMTIATLIFTCLLFIFAGLENLPDVKVAILTVGAFVCIAAAIAGDTSQDLKTGFLVGATPRRQQMGEFVGVVAAGLTMGLVMYALKDQITSGALSAPQANLMKLVIDGVIGSNLPWALVLSGVFIAMLVEMLGVNSLAFAVGLYLPMSLSTPIMAGGLIRMWVDWRANRSKAKEDVESSREAGVLYCSGMIAGAALIGLILAVMVGPRDNNPLLANTAQLLKRPGVVLVAKTPGEFKQDGQIVKNFIPQNWRDFGNKEEADSVGLPVKKTISLEFVPQDGPILEINFQQGRWDRTYIYADLKDIKRSSLHENAVSMGVLAFLILSLSLLWVVRPQKH